MNYGFIKACAVSPALRVADCSYNAQKTIEAMQQAAEDGCQLTVFPELGLTGYTCGDLFLQQPLLDAAEAALREILKAIEALQLVALVGLPVTVDAKLYNCAAVVCQGALLGLGVSAAWLLALHLAGRLMWSRAARKLTINGG